MVEFKSFMPRALELAKAAAVANEVPVGAVIVCDGEIIAEARNDMRVANDPTQHAELNAIRQACQRLGRERLHECDLYVTLEPCAMCAGAIANARIRRLYFGADDPKSGGVLHGARVFDHPQCHHRPEVYDGICADDARRLLQDFFKQKRG